MKKVFILLLLPMLLNACALCSLAVPKISANIEFKIADNRIKQLDISWIFSESFTQQLLQSYDANANDKFDTDEIEEMSDILITYVQPKNHLTQIFTYFDADENSLEEITFQSKNNNIYIENGKLHFMFSLELDTFSA